MAAAPALVECGMISMRVFWIIYSRLMRLSIIRILGCGSAVILWVVLASVL